MKFIILMFSIFALAACNILPKNPDEFRVYSQQHQAIHSITVDSPLSVVVSRLQAHAAKCISFDRVFERSSGVGGTTKFTSHWLTRWENASSKHPTFMVIENSPQTLNQPKDGQLWFVVDLAAKGSTTKATLYGLNGPSWVYDYTEEFTDAMHGNPAAKCPYELAK